MATRALLRASARERSEFWYQPYSQAKFYDFCPPASQNLGYVHQREHSLRQGADAEVGKSGFGVLWLATMWHAYVFEFQGVLEVDCHVSLI